MTEPPCIKYETQRTRENWDLALAMQLYIFLSVLSGITLMMTLYGRNTLVYELPKIKSC